MIVLTDARDQVSRRAVVAHQRVAVEPAPGNELFQSRNGPRFVGIRLANHC